MSATPRTDAFTDNALKNMSASGHLFRITDFARELERELAEAIKKADDADTDKLRAIGRLERELAAASARYIHECETSQIEHERAEAAEHRAAESEADARRYRWLNSQDHFMIYIAHSFANKDIKGEKSYRLKCGECLDSWIDTRIANIDAALASEAGKEG